MRVAELGAAGVIPQPIVDKLLRLIRRTRWLIVLRGACAVAAAAIGSLLAVMAVDASVTLFSLATRWTLTLSAYGLTALTAVWFLVRPLAHSFTLTGVARAIEAHHPELQERISSAVELLTSRDAPEVRGSEQLIGALVVQAADSARGIQPRREVTLRAARPYLAAAGALAAVFAAVFALWPDQARFLLTRASAPFINLPNLRARDLRVSPGDCTILEGQRLQVEVEVPRRGVRQAFFRAAQGQGEEAAEAMTLLGAEPGPRFVFTCPPATATFRYRIHAGDALSSFYTATVVPKPAIENLAITYEFPKYTQRAPVTHPQADGDIKALPGTTVTLAARTNKPVASAQFLLNGTIPADAKGEPLVATELAGGKEPAVTCRFRLGAELAGKWTLKLVDEHGFDSSTAEHAIEVVPDGPPTVAIIRPEARQLRLPPSAVVPITFTIEDDIGLAGAELLIEVDGRGRPARPIALPREPKKLTRAVASEASLQLGTLDLRNAKYVTFQLRATDNCPKELKGPHHGLSDLFRIELDVRAPSFATAELMGQEKKLKEGLERIKKDLLAAKKDSERLKESLPRHDKPQESDQKRIESMRKTLASADSTARKLAQEMEGGYLEKLGEKAKQLADDHIAKAENLAGQTKLAEEPERRGMLARETDRVIDRSIKAVEELLEEVEPVSDVVRRAIEMGEMAQREAELAKERLAQERAAEAGRVAEADMTPEDWQKAQAALASEMAEMLKDTPGAVQAALEADKAAAAAMAQEARAMAEQQRALAKENELLEKLQQIDNAIGQLAERQEKLAQEAAAGAASQPQAAPMVEAAKDIQAGQLAEAVKGQAAAEDALARAAQQMAQAPQAGAEAPAAKGAEAQAQPGAAPQTAAEVADLAKRQGELREQTQALAAERQKLAGEHAAGQMERLRAEQGEIARQAGELAQNAENVAPQAADGIQDRAAAAAAEAARALDNNQVPQAAQAAGEAAKGLGQLAERLEAAAAQPFAPQPQGAQQPQPGAAQQGEAQGGEQPQAGGEPAAQQGAEPAAGQQGAPKGGDQAQAGGQPAAPKGGEAAAPQAGQQPGGDQAQAGREGQQPGEQGQQAGAPQAGQPAGDQGATAQLAQQAAGLAQRQERLAREIQAIAAQNPVAAAAAQQAALAERAGDLARAAQAMEQRAQDLGAGSQAQAQAANAAAQLGQAQQSADNAAGQLAAAAGQQGQQPAQPSQGAPSEGAPSQGEGTPSQGQGTPSQGQGTPSQGQGTPSQGQGTPSQGQGTPSQGQGTPSQGQGTPSPGAASPSQQAAAQALDAAAGALGALSQSLGQAAAAAAAQAPPPGAAPPTATPGQMAQAYGSASQAAAAQSGMAAAQAAGQMSAMAAQAAGQAMASGGNLANQPHPQGGGNPNQGTGMQSTDLSESKLRELGIKLEDWARLPGELRNQILQAASDLGPEEYRPLIKRYFQQLSRRGSARPPKTEGKQP